jgi:hypothetical protein
MRMSAVWARFGRLVVLEILGLWLLAPAVRAESVTLSAPLSPTNEVPAIVNADQSASGTVAITLDLTRDVSGNITAATTRFDVSVAGFPPDTAIVGTHIHRGAAGGNGPVIIDSGIGSGSPVLLPSGSGSYTRNATGTTPALATAILADPSGFYFNVHTRLSPGGAIRAQLVRSQFSGAGNTLYFAQVADGGGFSTTFTLPNPSAGPVTGILRVFNQNGTPRMIGISGAVASEFEVAIPAGGSVRMKTDNTGPALAGWASFQSSAAVSGVAVFDLRNSAGGLATTAAVLGTRAARKFLIPVEVSAVSNTGMAVASVGGPAVVRLRLIDELGSEVSSVLDSRMNPLGPLQQLADFVTGFFPSVAGINTFRGSLVAEVDGEGAIAVTGLVLKEGLLSALPVVELAAADSTTVTSTSTSTTSTTATTSTATSTTASSTTTAPSTTVTVTTTSTTTTVPTTDYYYGDGERRRRE